MTKKLILITVLVLLFFGYWAVAQSVGADTTIETSIYGDLDMATMWGSYWSDVNKGVVVFVDAGLDISFARTTDGGANWTTTEIEAGAVRNLAAWYDKETPGDSGTLVHIVWLDQTENKAFYITVDVSDGSQGTKRTIDSTITVNVSSTLNRIAITKTVGGNLLMAFSTQTEIECYRSVDSGVNWTDRTDPYETATQEDYILLFPADTADDNDAVAIFWDRSSDNLSVKMYDDSGDSWTETSISGSMVDDTVHINMDGAVRLSDKHVLLASHSDDDSAGDDIKTWDLTVDSIASPTVTAKTNVVTDQAGSAQVGMIINQQNDDVYVAYLKGGTWQSTVDVVFHKSADNMGTWGSEQAYSEAAADVRFVSSGRTVGDDGGRIQFMFFNDDLTELFVNLVNDIEIAAIAPGGGQVIIIQMSRMTPFLFLIPVLILVKEEKMSSEIRTSYPTGNTIYALIFDRKLKRSGIQSVRSGLVFQKKLSKENYPY